VDPPKTRMSAKQIASFSAKEASDQQKWQRAPFRSHAGCLDTSIIEGKKYLRFGPYAGFSSKFLKHGSQTDQHGVAAAGSDARQHRAD